VPPEDRRARASKRWPRSAVPIVIILGLWIQPAAPAQTSTVRILAKPPTWTPQTSASFRFSSAGVECRLDEHRDPLAPWKACEDDPHTVEGLDEGRHRLEVRSAGGAPDAEPEDRWAWTVDLTPPAVARIYEPDALWQLRRHVTVSWGASDDRSGIADYDVRYDDWAPGGSARADVRWVRRSKVTGAGFAARGGRTYCLQAIARDRAGNRAPGWSRRRCFALPLDDPALDRHGRWIRRTNRFGYFLDGYSETTQRGAWASRRVVARRIALVATMCPRCGSVAVRWRGRVVKRVRLRAASTRRRTLIPVTSFSGRRRGTVRVDVISAGRPVRVDGLGVSAV
jgi:hypothetical protein